jgi:hypothetical protein
MGGERQVPLRYLLGLVSGPLRERRLLVGDIEPFRPLPSGVVRHIHIYPLCLKT